MNTYNSEKGKVTHPPQKNPTKNIYTKMCSCHSNIPWWHHLKLNQQSWCRHRCCINSKIASVSSWCLPQLQLYPGKGPPQAISLKSFYNSIIHNFELWVGVWRKKHTLILGWRWSIKGGCLGTLPTISKILRDTLFSKQCFSISLA